MTTVELVYYKYKPLKNGELPLKIRITKNRKIRYINLGVSTKPEHWDFSKNQPKSSCPNREQLEKLIANKIGEAKAQIVELKADCKEFTATSLVQKINNRDKSVSVRELFQEHLKYLTEMKRTGYMRSIKQTFNSLSAFSSSLDIPFSDIDLAWLRRYETWLRKQGKSENTIGIRFRNLRMIYNLAIEKGVAKKEYYPFSSYKVSKLHKATAKRAIPKEAIRAVIHYPVKGKDFYTRLAVSLFSFSYFMGGINFVDMAYLNSKNIVGGRLIYTRRKTGKLNKPPIKQRGSIRSRSMEKHREQLPVSHLVLSPQNRTDETEPASQSHHQGKQRIEAVRRRVASTCQIDTYVARHSFATVLKREGVSTSIICESLGHSSEKTTQIYLDSFENAQIDEAMKHLL